MVNRQNKKVMEEHTTSCFTTSVRISLSFSAFCFAFLARDKAVATFPAELSPQFVMVFLASPKISSNSASTAQIISTKCSPKIETAADVMGGWEEDEGRPLRTFFTKDKNADDEMVCFGDQVLNIDNKRVWYVVVSASIEFGLEGLEWCGVTKVRLEFRSYERAAREEKQTHHIFSPPLFHEAIWRRTDSTTSIGFQNGRSARAPRVVDVGEV